MKTFQKNEKLSFQISLKSFQEKQRTQCKKFAPRTGEELLILNCHISLCSFMSVVINNYNTVEIKTFFLVLLVRENKAEQFSQERQCQVLKKKSTVNKVHLSFIQYKNLIISTHSCMPLWFFNISICVYKCIPPHDQLPSPPHQLQNTK